MRSWPTSSRQVASAPWTSKGPSREDGLFDRQRFMRHAVLRAGTLTGRGGTVPGRISLPAGGHFAMQASNSSGV